MKKFLKFLKKVLAVLKKAFWNKTMLTLMLGAIIGALSMKMPESVIERFVCALPNVEGCEEVVPPNPQVDVVK